MPYDLKITGGTIVDGTGSPPRSGNVGISDGKIVALGEATEAAAVSIDAADKIVAPGFIDIHTHLDAQVMWDPSLSVSPSHGVTTVVIGNCGFGIAPTRPDDRLAMLRTLERVEGMSLDALLAGLALDWPFETFPEYLDAIEQRGILVNVAALLGHTPLRYYVMGVDDATSRAATSDEIAEMVSLATAALEAGAIGLSTSRNGAHVGFEGRPVPSRLAEYEELLELARPMSGLGRGVVQAAIGPSLGPERLGVLSRDIGRPVTFAAIMTDLGGPGAHRKMLERTERVQSDGANVIPQVSCRPLLHGFTLRQPYPLSTAGPSVLQLPTLDDIFRPVFEATSLDEMLGVYRRPGFLSRLVEATEGLVWYERLWSKAFVVEAPAGHADLEQRSLSDISSEQRRPAAEVLVSLGIDGNLETRFVLAHVNSDEPEVERLLHHPGTQLGLSDAGAHVAEICDSCFPTYLLGHWVRDKGSLSIEQAVAMLTGRAAHLMGITDRGVLEEGLAADVVVFDPETVAAGVPQFRFDLPGGAKRLAAEAFGVGPVVVNGSIIDTMGLDAPPADLPGRLLRGGRARASATT